MALIELFGERLVGGALITVCLLPNFPVGFVRKSKEFGRAGNSNTDIPGAISTLMAILLVRYRSVWPGQRMILGATSRHLSEHGSRMQCQPGRPTKFRLSTLVWRLPTCAQKRCEPTIWTLIHGISCSRILGTKRQRLLALANAHLPSVILFLQMSGFECRHPKV